MDKYEEWTATFQLRWASEKYDYPLVLQQLWTRHSGEQDWRTIPTVRLPGYDAMKANLAE